MTRYIGSPCPPQDLILGKISDDLGFDITDTLRTMTDEMAEKLAEVVGWDKEYWMTAYQAWEGFCENGVKK